MAPTPKYVTAKEWLGSLGRTVLQLAEYTSLSRMTLQGIIYGGAMPFLDIAIILVKLSQENPGPNGEQISFESLLPDSRRTGSRDVKAALGSGDDFARGWSGMPAALPRKPEKKPAARKHGKTRRT